jgi:hypothetical protein
MIKNGARKLTLALAFFSLTMTAGRAFAQFTTAASTGTDPSPSSVGGTDPVPPLPPDPGH